MSGRGNENHMGTNHPSEPFPLLVTFTLRSPPNPIDVFQTSAAKITLRTVFAANREKKTVKGRTLCLPTYRRDPSKVTFWLSVQPSMLTLAAQGEVDATPSGFPRITRERIGRSSRNLVYLSIELFYIFSENLKTVPTMSFDL